MTHLQHERAGQAEALQQLLVETDPRNLGFDTVEAVAAIVIRQLRKHVPFWSATVVAFDLAAGWAIVLASEGPSECQPRQRMALDQYGRDDLQVLDSGKLCGSGNAAELTSPSESVSMACKQGMKSYVRIPLQAGGSLVGGLDLFSDSPGFFSEKYVDIASAVAETLAVALQQATSMKQLQAQMAELEWRGAERTEQLQAANRELDALTYSVSHDLRAPLRHVDGFANLLREHAGDVLDDTGTRYMDTIVRAARRMGELIDGLLFLSRTGRADMHVKPVQPRAVVDEVLRDLAVPGGREVEWIIRPMPEVMADHGLFRVLWTNLLANAVKFTGQTRKAQIEVGVLPDDEGKCAADETVLFVKDNGAGFDMRFSQKLFGVFQRLHADEEFAGTGMGLATVRRIVERHGGRVWAEGQPGSGASFYFSLKKAGVVQTAAVTG